MKSVIHKAGTRGHADHGWLNTYHTFSFAGYYDPSRVHFGVLRVLNDDTVAGGSGFGRHPHDNMEIVSIPLEGKLEHQDSMGHVEVLVPGEIQVMSAGTGIFHSEYNPDPDQPLTFLQIWVLPKKKNVVPVYDQKMFDPAARFNKWQTIVSPDEEGTLHLNQVAWFSRITLQEGKTAEYTLHKEKNGIYLFVIEGTVKTADQHLQRRDGMGISGIRSVSITSVTDSELLLIEIPMGV
jgi:quercetin 2,3-dioxygenase